MRQNNIVLFRLNTKMVADRGHNTVQSILKHYTFSARTGGKATEIYQVFGIKLTQSLNCYHAALVAW